MAPAIDVTAGEEGENLKTKKEVRPLLKREGEQHGRQSWQTEKLPQFSSV